MRTRKYRGLRENRPDGVFVLPAMLFFSLFNFYPILNAFYTSFFNRKVLSRAKPAFVGLDNYASPS